MAKTANELNSMLTRAESLMDTLVGGELSKNMQRERFDELNQVLGRKRCLFETTFKYGAATQL